MAALCAAHACAGSFATSGCTADADGMIRPHPRYPPRSTEVSDHPGAEAPPPEAHTRRDYRVKVPFNTPG
jgi:hypothetical protein